MDTVIRIRDIGMGGYEEMKFKDAANESLSIGKRDLARRDDDLEWNWRLSIPMESVPDVIAVLEAFVKVNGRYPSTYGVNNAGL